MGSPARRGGSLRSAMVRGVEQDEQSFLSERKKTSESWDEGIDVEQGGAKRGVPIKCVSWNVLGLCDEQKRNCVEVST